MSKTGAELKLHAVHKDQGVEAFDDATVYEPKITHGKLIVQYAHDTGKVDSQGEPVYAYKSESIAVNQESLEALCAVVATSLSGTTFTGTDVEAIFKSGFESSAIG